MHHGSIDVFPPKKGTYFYGPVIWSNGAIITDQIPIDKDVHKLGTEM